MLDDFMKDVFGKKIITWFKKNAKFLMVILIYFLYQSNFLLLIASNLGIKIALLSRNLRMLTLITNDLIYIIILVMLFIKDIKFGLKDLKNNFSIRALLSVKCWVIGCLIMTISSLLISILIKQNLSTNEELVREQITLAPFYMLFACSIVAPIIEEMVFRKSLSGLIKCKWLFILVSGLGFGLLHVISSYSNPLEFLYIIPYGSMGCAFAYLLTKTNNITLPIIIHMIHNTVLVLSQIYGG